MEQQLRAYYQSITELVAKLAKAPNSKQIQTVLNFHLAQVNAFQHERLIHLLVTLFFAGLFLVFMLCSFMWTMWQFFALDIILVILLGFYIKHYFFLENTVQKLYPITKQLFSLLEPVINSQQD